MPRHVLEWRLDPHGDYRLAELSGPDHEVVLMCSEGYSSALSADLLQHDLGLTNVADLRGGFAAWKAAGLPWISHAPRQLPGAVGRRAGRTPRAAHGVWRGRVASVRRIHQTPFGAAGPPLQRPAPWRGSDPTAAAYGAGRFRGTGRRPGRRRSLTG